VARCRRDADAGGSKIAANAFSVPDSGRQRSLQTIDTACDRLAQLIGEHGGG